MAPDFYVSFEHVQTGTSWYWANNNLSWEQTIILSFNPWQTVGHAESDSATGEAVSNSEVG